MNFNNDSFSTFEFKKDLNEDLQKIEKLNVSEFGTESDVKFQKMKVKLDDVSFFGALGYDKEFSVKEVTVFLNVIVEGKANLYSYDSGNGVKYFYKLTDSDEVAKQLLYKKYYRLTSIVNENNDFREQLFNKIKCPYQTFNDFLNVKYDKDELLALFKNYNKCINSAFIVYENINKKNLLLILQPSLDTILGTLG